MCAVVQRVVLVLRDFRVDHLVVDSSNDMFVLVYACMM